MLMPLPRLASTQIIFEGKMFISNQNMPQGDDFDKPLVSLGKLVLVIAANVILARFGGPHLPNNIRF